MWKATAAVQVGDGQADVVDREDAGSAPRLSGRGSSVGLGGHAVRCQTGLGALRAKRGERKKGRKDTWDR